MGGEPAVSATGVDQATLVESIEYEGEKIKEKTDNGGGEPVRRQEHQRCMRKPGLGFSTGFIRRPVSGYLQSVHPIFVCNK